MGLDNLTIRQVNHLSRLHRSLNSVQHRLNVRKSKDAKPKFKIESKIHDIWGFKQVGWLPVKHVRAIVDRKYIPDPLGQLTRGSSRT